MVSYLCAIWKEFLWKTPSICCVKGLAGTIPSTQNVPMWGPVSSSSNVQVGTCIQMLLQLICTVLCIWKSRLHFLAVHCKVWTEGRVTRQWKMHEKVQFIHRSQEFGDLSPFLPFQMLCKVDQFVWQISLCCLYIPNRTSMMLLASFLKIFLEKKRVMIVLMHLSHKVRALSLSFQTLNVFNYT